MKTYRINEVFYSLQGEGVRAGTPNVFVRFSGCNMKCSQEPGEKSPGGFDCDTEFESGRTVTISELLEWCHQTCLQAGLKMEDTEGKFRATAGVWAEPWVILTGGEPGLQADDELIGAFHDRSVSVAIETNGSIDVGIEGISRASYYTPDWITVSPKVAEHCIRQTRANEVKYVRGFGQAIPKTVVKADHYLISPAFDGDRVHPEVMAWCVKLVKENPMWRLSVQAHKQWGVR